MHPKTVGLFVHSHREDRLDKASRTIDSLRAYGWIVYAEKWLADLPQFSLPPLLSAVDILLALGGDGTLLRAASYAIKWKVPLLGINLGRLGFLTEAEYEVIDEAIRLVYLGTYFTEKRMLLEIQINNGQKILALNDAVISRSGYTRIISIDASVSGDLIGSYRADGLIVSSPTGSTGYSLSAGGPIISPDLECIILTPICAHSLQHRPVVVKASDIIRLHLRSEEKGVAALVVDGNDPILLNSGAIIDVRKARTSLRLIRFSKLRFFSLVRNKLNEWTR